MMRSMTGFGKSVCELSNKIVSVEIRSLNSKQLDIFTRIPNIYKDKELEMRNMISQELNRGKIELIISYENTDSASTAQINTQIVKEYYNQIREIAKELGADEGGDLLQTVMRFPESLKIAREEMDEKEWAMLAEKIGEALGSIKAFRAQEGIALEKDIMQRVDRISELLAGIDPFETERVNKIRERIHSSLTESLEKENIDESRFEQELIYYLEKIDITEEKVRLKNHCEYFREVTRDTETVGKKLGFIAQEMGREINTLGSKANHSEIQRIVVQMKDELEKIKEQLMNVL
jgi:uncharacterized protein (TIGR00255 family)